MDTVFISEGEYIEQTWSLFVPALIILLMLLVGFIALRYYERKCVTKIIELDEKVRNDSWVIAEFTKRKFLCLRNDSTYDVDLTDSPDFAYKCLIKKQAEDICEALNEKGWNFKVISIIEATALYLHFTEEKVRNEFLGKN